MLYKIYVIKNLINRKIYIGTTYKNITIRFKEHLTSIHRARSNCRHLINAIKKYGKKYFYVEFICATENKDDSLELEKIFIKQFDSILNGYNLSNGGKKLSQHSDETKNLISKSMKGKNSGSNNPFFGKTHSDESRFKISNSNKGHPGYALGKTIHSKESKQKISAANAGSKARSAILNEAQVKHIKILLQKGERQITIAKLYGVTKTIISNIFTGRTWKHVNILNN